MYCHYETMNDGTSFGISNIIRFIAAHLLSGFAETIVIIIIIIITITIIIAIMTTAITTAIIIINIIITVIITLLIYLDAF